MDIITIISEIINEIFEDTKIWYHGTPDVNDIEKQNSFSERIGTTDYITDPEKKDEIQKQMNLARKNGNEDLYFKLLDDIHKLRKKTTYKKPIFFSDDPNVAATYADEKRAFDYQNARPKIIRAIINDNGKVLKIPAYGKSFRGIDFKTVEEAFQKAGIPKEKINKLIKMFSWFRHNDEMTADTLATIAQKLGFDIVDIIGILDSYNGGSKPSIIRMVFDPNRIKII